MKTVLILGAGVTRASGLKRSQKKRPPLDSDFFETARFGENANYKKTVACLQNLVGDYSCSLVQSLETAATYLYIKAIDSKLGSEYHKGFLNLIRLLVAVFAETTNDLKVGPSSLIYRFLLSELNKTSSPSDLSIITFNYDLLIEKTLDQIAKNNRGEYFYFPGCYRLNKISSTTTVSGEPQFESIHNEHKGIAILKLHGSMSWQSRHTSDEPKPSALFSRTKELHILNSTTIAEKLTWKRRQRRVYMKPVIIPPVSGKRGMMHQSMSTLWDNAARCLREANRIVIAGYSCPPLDLEARILLSENLRRNDEKKVYVIDPDSVSAAKFLDLCGVNHTTIYNSISNWIKDGKER